MNSKDYHRTKGQILEYLRRKELYEKFCKDIDTNINIFQKSLDMFKTHVDKELVLEFIKSLRDIQCHYDSEISRSEYENL